MKNPIRILHVDDNILDRELTRDALILESSGFELTEAKTHEEFLEKIESESFDVVLTDFNILGFLGFEVMEKVKSKNKDTPVIIVTGTGSEEIAVEAMRKGASDYVIKTEKHIRRLPETIRQVLEKEELKRENKRLEERIFHIQKLESLGLLAGGIAHDFNNLLGGIFGFIEIAMTEVGTKKSLEYLAKAMASIERARALTIQLLTFAKGGTPIKKVWNFSPFLQDTVQFALSGSKISANFLIPDDIWQCEFDKNQIAQVIDNIVINAVHAMPEGGIIEVQAKNVPVTNRDHLFLKPGNYVKISLIDHGIGIPKEYLPKIFDPFYTTKPNGHGLGLSSSFSIINRHEGCIDVESEPGKGSAFHIFLPTTFSAENPAHKEKSETHEGEGIFLVMDDESTLREAISIMLESFGYSVILTANGEEVLNCYNATQREGREIAGMIFDLTVPGGMGGIDTLSEIRKLGYKNPVFVTSGYSEDPIIAKPASYGFDGSISKPFTRADLIKLLNEKK